MKSRLERILKKSNIAVIIPALNEEESIKLVVKEVPKNIVSEIVVVDNGSTDDTRAKAKESGATVVTEPKHGYGRACKAGVRHLEKTPPEIVVFLDADYSDYPADMSNLVQPIVDGNADLVLGSRLRNDLEKDAILSHAVAANRYFSRLINLMYDLNLTDLGPFRAIRWNALGRLNMKSDSYGWSCEMIVKTAKLKFKIMEVPVRYRRRIGRSKISGNIVSSLRASLHILYNIMRHRIY